MAKQYIYTKIADLVEGTKDVNIYGIVKFYREPRRLATGDWNAIYTLIDSSVKNDSEQGICCNLFASSKDKLPKVSEIGDIIRFHRMHVVLFKGRLQMNGSKSLSSWLVYKKIDGYTNPISSHPNFTVTIQEKNHLQELKKFLNDMNSQIDPGALLDVTLLKDICLNKYYNLVVQIIDIFLFEENPNCCVLRVSDGTDVFYNSFRYVGSIPHSSEKFSSLTLITAKHCYEISLFDNHVLDCKKLRVGDFIQIRNVHSKTASLLAVQKLKMEHQLDEVSGRLGWVELILHTGCSYNRGISVADQCNKYVKEIQERMRILTIKYNTETQMASEKLNPSINSTQMMSTEYLTKTDFLSQVTPIAQVLAKETGLNRIKGKLLALKPNSVHDFIVNICTICFKIDRSCTTKPLNTSIRSCQQCPAGVLIETFFFELLVEDDSGIIDLEVFDDDAVEFLNQVTTTEFISNETIRRNITEKFQAVEHSRASLKKSNSIDHLPSVDLCVSSFKGDEGEIIRRVFRTTLA